LSAKAEQRQRSHKAILQSAADIVRQRGIAGARVADIMSGAGLTVGGFYAHFKSKQELIDETILRTVGASWERLFASVDTKPAADRLEIFLKRYLSTTHRDGDARGCPFPAIVGEIATTAPEHRGTLARTVEPLVERLTELLPDIHDQPRRRLVAIGLVALMYGGLSLSRAVRGTALSDEILEACRVLSGLAIRQVRDEAP